MRPKALLVRFSAKDVLAALAELTEKHGYPATAAMLGYARQHIYLVLAGKVQLTERLALRLGYIKLPDAYAKVKKDRKAALCKKPK